MQRGAMARCLMARRLMAWESHGLGVSWLGSLMAQRLMAWESHGLGSHGLGSYGLGFSLNLRPIRLGTKKAVTNRGNGFSLF